MKTVAENKHYQMSISEEHAMVKVVWKPETEDMTTEEFK